MNIVGNKIRNSGASCPPHTAIRYELHTGRIERNSISGVVQECAVPSPLALPAAIWVGSLRGYAPPSPVVRFNDIQGNAHAGLRVGPNITTSLDARCNYWGSEDGPSGVGTGTGDAVLVETGGAGPVLAPFATGPVARHRHGRDHDGDDDDDRHGGGRCHLEYSLWSEPVNLPAPINTAVAEFDPALSRDGLALYINTNRPGGSGGNDLWVARRACVTCAFGAPVNLGGVINTAAQEGGPELSPDGLTLFFQSDRPGGQGARDIYVSHRSDPTNDLGWGAPVNLGPDVNTGVDEYNAGYLHGTAGGPDTLYFQRGPASADLDIYSVALSTIGQPLGPAVLVPELSAPGVTDATPAIRRDGREVIFSSTRPGGFGLADLWSSIRRGTGGPWSPPENLGTPVNLASTDNGATLSSDGRVLLFSSNRAGGVGAQDLWMSTRTRIGR